ncbi:hypothetical protein GobsT_75230 [Gemmata obscuriglobus]|uniref:Uncharacterized protein n=1 Tax=Gemmata obscuriglobus TaxID=114 RepID=A0A2Z3H3S0_9BACT|nr:hypothetical protein [Gemmata obscuriglobus]AWM41429.1 hypothetical protein C1280_33485 [Gemmata obscuriglobus]QEG32665.1 hypothetical protein GobsT_75230 [Gemmata obscuriglobus]VTS12021.1 unnamed protein product [Gemmata obscuriglobus UQM 2246]
MTAIGKLLAFLLLVVGLTMMTWAVGVYAQRPTWFNPVPEGGAEKGEGAAGYAELKAEIDSLGEAAKAASGLWGETLKSLEAHERFRANRRNGYAQLIEYAHKGNPKDLIDPANPKSGKGFYLPVVDPKTRLYDLSFDAAGRPKGEAVLGSEVGADGKALPLPGLDALTNSVSADTQRIELLTKEITDQRRLYDTLSAEVLATEKRLVAMNTIRDSVQAELFFLDTFEVDVFETRETVQRRASQLRGRLKLLGVSNP